MVKLRLSILKKGMIIKFKVKSQCQGQSQGQGQGQGQGRGMIHCHDDGNGLWYKNWNGL